jgi:hypothetical protein
MAYMPHTLIAFGGKLTTNSPPDSWQSGIRVRLLQPDGISQGNGVTDPAAFLTALAPLLLTWFQAAAVVTAGSERAAHRSDAYLDWLKVNNIGTDGKYSSQVSHTFSWDGTKTGSATPTGQPPFVTAAVSLLTALTRGPGHRGRIYLPLTLALTPQGTLSALQQAQCNGIARSLLTTIAGVTDANGTVIPIVASKVNGSRAAINAVATGSVFDVQRRRKEQILETYVTRTWP